MPRLTSKMTLKIEPELLRRIQAKAESRGVSVSYYVREAVIEHIRETEEEISPSTMRINMTLMETHVLTQLIRIGAMTEPQEMFHKAFDSYVSNDLERTLNFAHGLKDMREFPSMVPLTTRRSRTMRFNDLEIDDDLEGDIERKDRDKTGSG